MSKRIVTKVGDIFITKDGTLLQLIAIDKAQLSSDVVVVYKEKNRKDFSQINEAPILFYHHTTVSAGVKLGFWHKIGKGPIPNPASFVFKQYFDKDTVEILNETSRNILKKMLPPKPYYVYWHVNENIKHKISEKRGNKLEVEEGSIVPPSTMVDRIYNKQDSL